MGIANDANGYFCEKITVMFKSSLYLSIALFFSFVSTSCTDGAESTTSKTDTTHAVVNSKSPSSNLSKAHTDQLLSMVTDYYELKDAFVKTDAARTEKAATRVVYDAETFNHDLRSDTANYSLLTNYLQEIMTSAEAITNMKDETCELKRPEFEKTSNALYALLIKAGVKDAGIYQQHCPMAFDDKGASWLSASDEIMNPYLPKKMLHCGEVQDTL